MGLGSFPGLYALLDQKSASSLHAPLVDSLRASIPGGSLEKRVRAIGALAKIADKGDTVVIKAVAESLEDAKGDVRRAAIDALEEVAGRGNVVAIKA